MEHQTNKDSVPSGRVAKPTPNEQHLNLRPRTAEGDIIRRAYRNELHGFRYGSQSKIR